MQPKAIIISIILAALTLLGLITLTAPTCRPPDPEFCTEVGGQCLPKETDCPEGQVKYIPNQCPAGQICCGLPPAN
jgi:hypothetical protein